MTLGAVSIVVSSVSLVISIIIAYRNWNYSEVSIRYASRNHYMNALFEMDKQMIANPRLWAIDDFHPIAQEKSNQTEEKAKRDAFIYYNFNLFESIYHDYNNVLYLSKADKQFWDSWKRNMINLFVNSSEARTIFRRKFTQQIYMKNFVDFVNAILANYDQGKYHEHSWTE